jgi:hypothetical protein
MFPQYDIGRSQNIIATIQDLLWNPDFPHDASISEESYSLVYDAQNILRTKDGPFLVSFDSPIDSVVEFGSKTLLIADLSDAHPLVITTVVDEYMKTLEKTGSGIEVFESLKARILERLLKLSMVTQDVFTDFLLIREAFSAPNQ